MQNIMFKRWAFYSAICIAAIPVVVWLAFGPGVATPYVIFTWPGDRLLWHLNPAAGSFPATDVLSETVVSAAIWFVTSVSLDTLVVLARHRVRPLK
jgi:hypothetical protein